MTSPQAGGELIRPADGQAAGANAGYSDSGNHSRAILRLMVGGSPDAVRRGRDLILTCTRGMIAPFDGSRARPHLTYERRLSPATPSGKFRTPSRVAVRHAERFGQSPKDLGQPILKIPAGRA